VINLFLNFSPVRQHFFMDLFYIDSFYYANLRKKLDVFGGML